MSKDGFENQIALDYCENAIHRMQSQHQYSCQLRAPVDNAHAWGRHSIVKYEQGDATNLRFSCEEFMLVIDKGLLDPLFEIDRVQYGSNALCRLLMKA